MIPVTAWPALSTEHYPTLTGLVAQLDVYLQRKYPDFFGPNATHPVLPVKRSKVIHDSVWGTNRFSWQELVVLDSPIIQRLRNIQQVGLAHLVYPSARHTRFEHSLGVVTIASRVFDALYHRDRGTVRTIMRAILQMGPQGDDEKLTQQVMRLRQELRLAALLHDSGHSMFSHAAERVYSNVGLLIKASDELSEIVGMDKGAGEVLSFCLAMTPSIKRLIERPANNLIGDSSEEDYLGGIDMTNVALLIVGRSRHPYLQFMGDIISSSLDADKLDYLMRDSISSGLPLRYDLDMYLYSVRLHKDVTADGKRHLQSLYEPLNPSALPQRNAPRPGVDHESYDMYRLRLPKKAMHVIEQIVICKLMLFSYMYHHSKVRAAEGMLEKMLERLVHRWSEAHASEAQIVERFLEMTDSSLGEPICLDVAEDEIPEYCNRLTNRVLPREVYGLSKANASHAEGALLATFLNVLQDKCRRKQKIAELEHAIGEELLGINGQLAQTVEQALAKAGVWVDVAKPPKFEDLQDLVIEAGPQGGDLPVSDLFPIGQWQQAWTHYRYYVRIYAFSEYLNLTEQASKRAMKRVIGIESEGFYTFVRRVRS